MRVRELDRLKDFNNIYNITYDNTLKYIVLHCNDFEDVNDLMQDTYLELYKHFKKKKFDDIQDVSGYVIGIAKNIMNKYYRKKYNNPEKYNREYNEEILNSSDSNIELDFITKENVEIIWNYIQKKDVIVAKVFYCYYFLDMKISEISKELQLNESTIKNYIYRTIKEIKNNLNKESGENV